jgi:hypothetical protein
MPTPWLKRIRKTGQLAVHNKTGAWAPSVNTAMTTFNALGLGVELVSAKEEKAANIVVLLSSGSDVYKYYGDTATAKFDATELHGQTSTLTDQKVMEIFFAAIFLPGKVKEATGKQKGVIVVHEFIHACGLNGLLPDGSKAPNDDHESSGIMFAQMKKDGDGLIEYLPDKGAKPMPPIRLGGRTLCKMQMLWSKEGCKDD